MASQAPRSIAPTLPYSFHGKGHNSFHDRCRSSFLGRGHNYSYNNNLGITDSTFSQLQCQHCNEFLNYNVSTAMNLATLLPTHSTIILCTVYGSSLRFQVHSIMPFLVFRSLLHGDICMLLSDHARTTTDILILVFLLMRGDPTHL